MIMIRTLLPLLAALALHLLVHEGAHALSARAFGFRLVRVRWNPLAPGVVVTDDRPPGVAGSRWRWAVVHLAGPTANLAVAAFVALVWAGWVHGEATASAVVSAWTSWPSTAASPSLTIAWLGVLMAAINLVPLPPFDGGRLVVALLTGHAGPWVRPVSAALWVVGTPLFAAAVILALRA